MCSSFTTLQKLTVLELWGTFFWTVEPIPRLPKILSMFKDLQELNLSDTNEGDNCLRILGENCPKLRYQITCIFYIFVILRRSTAIINCSYFKGFGGSKLSGCYWWRNKGIVCERRRFGRNKCPSREMQIHPNSGYFWNKSFEERNPAGPGEFTRLEGLRLLVSNSRLGWAAPRTVAQNDKSPTRD